MSARVEGLGIISRKRPPSRWGGSAGILEKQEQFGRSQGGQTVLSRPFTAAYKFHKKEMNYALLSFHKVTQ